ncbi:MAG: peptidoglycan DD-metalloendopeptidase family protein [Pseudomonadota bacterium]
MMNTGKTARIALLKGTHFGGLRFVVCVVFFTLLAVQATLAQTSTDPTTPQNAQAAFEQLNKARVALEQARLAGQQLTARTKQLEKDLVAINRALVTVADRSFKLEGDVTQSEERLTVLQATRSELIVSSRSKRAALAQVVGALQRIGRNPPPALLIHPRNALRSVRSSILLGAVIPHMRDEGQVLLAELNALKNTTREIETTGTALAAQLDALSLDENQLTLLLEDKRKLASQTKTALRDEQKRIADLAKKAKALEALVQRLENEAQASAKMAELAKARDEARRSAELARLEQAKQRLATGDVSVEEAGQIDDNSEKVSVNNELTGNTGIVSGDLASSRLPVSGKRVSAKSSFPGLDKAVAFSTKGGARVRAPNAGTVLYAGPFRTFGTLLILDAGDEYTWVMAGLAEVNVTKGQAVVAGEPVGKMGQTSVAAARIGTLGSGAPLLYVELRRDGKAVDPGPIWARGTQEGPANDT